MSVVMDNVLAFLVDEVSKTEDYKELNNLARVVGSLKTSYSYKEDLQAIDMLLERIEAKKNQESSVVVMPDNSKIRQSMKELIEGLVSRKLPLLLTGTGATHLWEILTIPTPKKCDLVYLEAIELPNNYIVVESSLESEFKLINIALHTADSLNSLVYLKEGSFVRVIKVPTRLQAVIADSSGSVAREAVKRFFS